MSGLLVSVRSAAEAALALAAGVDLIDVKEPSAGSLGAASAETIQSVAELVAGRVSVSAACGELCDLPEPLELDRRVQFAKFGLARCGADPAWPQRWRQAIAQLPGAVRPVAVVYADWPTCAAPSPPAILAAAIQQRCAAVLIDTFDKTRGGLFAHLTREVLEPLIDDARAAEILVVLAGSLDRDTLPIALALGPDFVAVRGCVCHGDRTSRLDPVKLAEIVALIRGQAPLDGAASVATAPSAS